MNTVKYGIIGLGQVATKAHIPDLLSIPGAEIVAVADTNPDALERTTEVIHDVRTYADYRQLVADESVEVVLVSTPNWLHAEQVIAAFEAGKHVFCEKPLGIDLEECDAILAAQKKSGKLVQVGYEMRYSQHMRKMYQCVRDGMIGDVQMMLAIEMRFPLLPGWRQTNKAGGIMLEKNSHFFDLFNWFAGAEPRCVIGVGGNNVNVESPMIDNCVVTVEYANNVRGTLLMCLFAERDTEETGIHVIGDRGRLVACDEERRMFFHSRVDSEKAEWTFEDASDGAWHPGMKSEHEAFIRCIREGEPVLCDGDEARKLMRVCLAAEKVVASGINVYRLKRRS